MIPLWLEETLRREMPVAITSGSPRIAAAAVIAVESRRDLADLAVETARTNCPQTAARNLFGGDAR